MKTPLDICCAADLCVDVILRGNVRPRFSQIEQLIGDYQIELGGSATIFASQFVKLGGRAGVIGVVGDDLFGRYVCQRLAGLNLEASQVRIDPQVRTGVGFALTEPDDRAILTYTGGIDALTAGDLTADLSRRARHWHIASYFLMTRLQAAWPMWLRTLRQAGVTSSLDTNWSPREQWSGVTELLPWVDVFLPNQAEARAISGCADTVAAGRTLAGMGPLVVIKCGADGAMAFAGHNVWRTDDAGQFPPVSVVDTIGAGDCFDAGLIRAWQRGRPIERCLELAMRCGRANVQSVGGIQGQLREVVA